MNTLYFYKNEKGYLAFQNQNPFHTDKIHLAYASGKINLDLSKNGYEVEQLTVDEFQKIYAPIVSEILVVGDLLIHKYKDYNENFPTIPGDHKLVRNSIRNSIQKMSHFHKQIDEILKENPNNHDDFYESQGDLSELISHISNSLRDGSLKSINKMFEANSKDQKSIEGIVKKILK